MLHEEWIQHTMVGILVVAALLYLIISARRRKRKSVCPYCPTDRPS